MSEDTRVWVPSDLVNTVDAFLEEAKNDPNVPQFKNRQALLEFALNRFLRKHAATPLTLQVPNGIIRFYKEHEKWLQVNDAVDNLPEWLTLAFNQYAEATIDTLYTHEDKRQLLIDYGFKEEN